MSVSKSPQALITDHIDIWTSAIERKSSAGRGSSNKYSLYGIKKLRELILELAVRGKLVPQASREARNSVEYEPASVLLERIAAEKAQLVKEGKLKKQKPLPEISDDEKPFELPKSWSFQRLTDIYYSISPSGKKLKSSEISDTGEYPVVDQGQEFISGYSDNSELLISIEGPVIVFGDHTRNIKLIDFDFIAGADGTKILSPICIDPKYFYIQLLSYALESRGYGRHFKILNDNLISIPPLEEQHRIVAKVDELMSLCDALEAQTEASISAHQTLVETLLNALLLPNITQQKDSQSASSAPSLIESLADSLEPAFNDSFVVSWQRVAEHFDTLFTTAASIDTLKQTILQLAVMGKLVPQDPNDELVEELIEKIYTEHCARQLSTKEKIVVDHEYQIAKKSITKNVALIKARFICGFITKGTTPSKPELLEAGEVPFLKVYNIVRNKLDFAYKPIFISAETNEGKLKRSRVFPNDVIMNIVGPPLGKVAVITDAYPEWNMNQALAVFRPLAGIDSQYLYYMLPTDTVLASVLKEVKGTAGQDNLSLEQCRDLLIPVPSIKQQRKIVELIEELMALCDQLKARLSDAQTTQLHLTDAIVEQAV
jgi:type I restriction enzyme S subunit